MYDYDAFGNQQDVPGYDADGDTNPFRYCREYLDAETDTYYLRARNYNPSTGRFLAEDPHWNPSNMVYDADGRISQAAIAQSGNLYVYGLNNPLRYSDPSGKIAIADDAVILIVLATGAVYTYTVAWANSAEGQAAIQGTVEVIVDGVSYIGDALGGAIESVNSWGQQQAGANFAKTESGEAAETTSKAHDKDQQAVVGLAKGAKKGGGLDQEDAETLTEWAGEYGVPKRTDLGGHPTAKQPTSRAPHIHIGKIGHIPIKGIGGLPG